MRPLLRQLEQAQGDELLASLAYLAAQGLPIDPDELHAARRRSLLILAAGGDPRRELTVDASAVTRLAGELDDPGLRAELHRALSDLHAEAGGLPGVAAALESLLADPEQAMRWLAAALLAEELAEER